MPNGNGPEMPGKVEQINSLVRAICTVAIVGTCCFGFVKGIINGDAFLAIVGVVITFWFQQRGQKEAVDQAVKIATTPTPSPTSTPVTTTPAPASGETVTATVTKEPTR